MEEAITTILTNENARSGQEVEGLLIEQGVATPWAD
jgi:hypothetical protein